MSIWVDKRIVESDKVNMLAPTPFIVATAVEHKVEVWDYHRPEVCRSMSLEN